MAAPESSPGLRALDAVASFGAEHAAALVRTADGLAGARGDLDYRYAFASLTKPLVAYAVLLAAEEGSLDLDEAAGPPGATVAHLLAHASGLGPDDPERPLAPAGRRRIYSSAGYAVLGELVAERTGMPLADYLDAGVCQPLGMTATRLEGHPGYGAIGTAGDLGRFLAECLAPRLLDPLTLERATSIAFPGLDGVLPGFGRQRPCDWGLGFELRDHKSPHWTGERCSPATFGHFGQAGSCMFVDPEARVALVACSDRPFGEWAAEVWPALADRVLAELAA